MYDVSNISRFSLPIYFDSLAKPLKFKLASEQKDGMCSWNVGSLSIVVPGSSSRQQDAIWA